MRIEATKSIEVELTLLRVSGVAAVPVETEEVTEVPGMYRSELVLYRPIPIP